MLILVQARHGRWCASGGFPEIALRFTETTRRQSLIGIGYCSEAMRNPAPIRLISRQAALNENFGLP
jgi:hypothetical protein